MAKLEIQIQMRKMISPSTPTPNHLRNLSLSFFDQGAPRIYVPIMFHYLPSSECNREGITERCDKLQNSLAETLTNFYPLAGRFREDEFSIHCNDEGVEFVESKSAIRTSISPPSNRGPKIITRRFVFDALAIAKLKDRINSSATFTKTYFSGVRMSLIWKEISVTASLEANQLRKELNDFVNSIGSTARDTSLSIGKASVDEIISLSINCGAEIINKLGQGDEMDIYASTSWYRFLMYEADFGWESQSGYFHGCFIHQWMGQSKSRRIPMISSSFGIRFPAYEADFSWEGLGLAVQVMIVKCSLCWIANVVMELKHECV
ncbi:hypothetical protein HAX54_036812 [Datura stramonium]|uniref:Uncharacterized protein n=1 Tax=Datura stramonium TaxID=4076 RepID=A0ABS8RMH2_DATST|nr:hypothetical protein [Datura stramonium]